MVTLGGVVVHVVAPVAGVFVVKCCQVSTVFHVLFFLGSLKYVSFIAFVSGFNYRCFLRSRCSMEMWCPDDIGRDSWDWVGPPIWERA